MLIRTRLLVACLLAGAMFYAQAAVEFPGASPGPAKSSQSNKIFKLENSVVAASWVVKNGTLAPARFENKLTGVALDQSGAELFRLGRAQATPPGEPGVYVAVRLNAGEVIALASTNGRAWTELASFPRSEFAGEPKLVRLGKMDLKAQARNYSGGIGEIGEGEISQITPQPASIPAGRFAFKAGANEAKAAEFPFPNGTAFVSCRIDKGSDKGM